MVAKMIILNDWNSNNHLIRFNQHVSVQDVLLSKIQIITTEYHIKMLPSIAHLSGSTELNKSKLDIIWFCKMLVVIAMIFLLVAFEKNALPPQMMELDANDRLHLGTISFTGQVYDIQFCVHLVRAS